MSVCFALRSMPDWKHVVGHGMDGDYTGQEISGWMWGYHNECFSCVYRLIAFSRFKMNIFAPCSEQVRKGL